MNEGKLAVKFKTFTKIVYVKNHATIYDEIQKVFKSILPAIYTLKYEDKEFSLVDLDSPIQLTDRKSNILFIEGVDPESNTQKESNVESNISETSSLSRFVFCVFQ